MTLIFSGHCFAYEAERLFRAFFPPVKIAMTNGAEGVSGDFCVTERVINGRIITLCVKMSAGDFLKELTEEIPADTPEKEQERALCVLLYRVLSEYTGVTPPWGILTGIRPVRLLAGMDEKTAAERLLVSPGKTALAHRINAVQKPIIAGIPERSFSLYVSIPFCPTRCSYCSFVSHSVDKAAGLVGDYLDRLCEELSVTADTARQAGLRLDTIYFGGGTPTTLSAEQLKRLFSALGCFDLSNVREFTVEAGRPDTITRDKLIVIKQAGARRISVNPQTMNDSVLEAVGRRHTAAQTERAYELAREIGFDSINMDLIAGLPTDTVEGFIRSIDRVCELSPENITVHSLSLKRAARLFRERESEPSGAYEMTSYAHKKLSACGYEPYYLYRQKNTADNCENTGYAKPGTESLYNMFIMEEVQTILAVGAGASTKLVDIPSGRIERVTNLKYPYEYLGRFNEVIAGKSKIIGFFDK